jgi:DNA recombination protein RmuC
MDSVRRHIRELAEKNYQSLHQLQSIDFVCMFVPIEGAFMAAISSDSALWESSYERNVLLVSPSTLLFVVRTVAHLWRQERQKQNVQEIVNRGAELYDKLAGFVEDLKSVGERLEQAKTSYGLALNKLSTGKGNVIRQAEMLKALGVKPKKNLPVELVDASAENEPLLPEQTGAASNI